MKKKMKFMRVGILALAMILALSFTLVSCEQTVEPEDTTGVEETIAIPTEVDITENINRYVDQLIDGITKLEDPETIDVTNLLKTLSDVDVTLDNPSPDNSVFGGMDKIVFANNTLRAEGKEIYDGQVFNSVYVMRLTENGIVYLSGEDGKYTGEYQTWLDTLGVGNEDTFTFSQIDFEAIRDALKVEKNDIKVVEEGVYKIKSSYIINAIKSITKALGFEDTDNSVSFDTLLNMSLIIDVRQYAGGIMNVDLDIPDVVKARVNILDKDELKVEYELHILGGEDAAGSNPAATLTGSVEVKASEFAVSAKLNIPVESVVCELECSGENVDAQLSVNCKLDIQYGDGESAEKLSIEAQASAETDSEGNITLIDADASITYNARKMLSAALDYNVTDDTATGKCYIEILGEIDTSDKMVIDSTLSAKLGENKIPATVDAALSVSFNNEEIFDVKIDCELSETEPGKQVIDLNAIITEGDATADIDFNIHMNDGKLFAAGLGLKITGTLDGLELNQPTEPPVAVPYTNSEPETFTFTATIDTKASSEISTKYQCVFIVTDTAGVDEKISFDVTIGESKIGLTDDEKLLLGYYEGLLANYQEYVAMSESYANAVRQMAEQGTLPSIVPESFCLVDPHNHKVGYFCDIYRNYDGTYEVYCVIDVNDTRNAYLEYYPVVETFFTEKTK